VRVAALAYVRRRRGEGASQELIAGELGISQHTVSTWLRRGASKVKGSLVPVKVDNDGPTRRLEIVVTTPRGFRIDGLDVDTLCAVVARLG
jgi:transposase